MKTKKRVLLAIEIATPLIIIVLWWAYTAFVLPVTSPFVTIYYPTPVVIAERFAEDFLSPEILVNGVPTLVRFLVGYGIAAVVGIVLGVIIGSSSAVRLLSMPVITFFRAMPAVVLIPIVTIFLGITDAQKILLIALASLWPILLNAIDGVRSLDFTIRESAISYRIKGFDRYRFVIVPAALPQIFAGLRAAVAVALIVVVVVELFGAGSGQGIGSYLATAKTGFEFAKLWAGILFLGIVGLIFNGIFLLVERRVLRWHHGRNAVEAS